MTQLPDSTAPLSGVRVLDLAGQPAVFATRILADMGCDVIRPEPPGGDGLRRLAPFVDGIEGTERSLWHLYLNAGKQSVVIDRQTPAGREKFWLLVASADIIIETECLDHDEVASRNPSAIHVTVSPFGLDGERAHWRATDLTCVAAGGLAYVCGSQDGPPLRPGGEQAHKLAGLAAAAAAVIALHGRDRSPASAGIHLDIAVQDAVAASMIQTANPSFWAWHRQVPRRPGLGAVLQCADGRWVTLTVRPNRRLAFADWAERRGAGHAAEWAALRDPAADLQAVWRAIVGIVGAVPRDEVMAAVARLDLMGLPVNTLPDLADCDHLQAIGEFTAVEHENLGRTLHFPRSPAGDLAWPVLSRAPGLGEHDALLTRPRPAPGPAAGPSEPAGQLDLAAALAGIRVIDFCWMLAGPLGTRLLAEHGAEVIRIEAGPRAFPDRFPDGTTDASLGAYHNTLNAGKRSVTIDPRHSEGRELILELVAGADVVTNNYRPDAFERLGFTDAVLRDANPRIINMHMPGSGRTGPWARIGTYGTMVAAAAGLNYVMGADGTPPRGMGTAYADFTTPYLVPLLVLAALRERDRTGRGMDIELNQLSAAISLLGVEWLEYDTTGIVPPRPGNSDRNLCPHGIYPAAGDDEWVALAASEADFDPLCDLIGRADLAARLPTLPARMAAAAELDAVIASWTSQQDKWQAAVQLQARGIAAAPVQDLRDSMESDKRLAVRHYVTVSQPSHPDIAVPVQNTVIQQAGAWRPPVPAPAYGADNDDVAGRLLGRPAEEISRLRAAGVIRGHGQPPTTLEAARVS